ncbi:ATP-binding cassette domain-containing protein [Caldifermentibacillus hisashii]|uniref:ATP-binding cassette domain-containing protein n=1 Tax=Caldifermentibacillus hisashii TaxID=996558 RepID=UPI0038D223D0
MVGLLGPNGAGKSTTISIISTLMPPTSGEVLLEGESVLQTRGRSGKSWGSCPRKSPFTTIFPQGKTCIFSAGSTGCPGKD